MITFTHGLIMGIFGMLITIVGMMIAYIIGYNITKPKPKNIHMFAYESAFIITIYTWFDWFLYYNILVSQIDLLLVEITMDLIMAGIITNYYVNHEIIVIKPKSEYDLLL